MVIAAQLLTNDLLAPNLCPPWLAGETVSAAVSVNVSEFLISGASSY